MCRDRVLRYLVDDHTVIMPDEGDTNGYALCTCANHTSTLMPCRHICKVASFKNKRTFSIEFLHPRWRLINHPLWGSAKHGLGHELDAQRPSWRPDTYRVPIDTANDERDSRMALRNDADESEVSDERDPETVTLIRLPQPILWMFPVELLMQ